MSEVKKPNVIKLVHTKENVVVEVSGKTQAAIIAEVKANNLTLGTKSLSSLLNGEKKTSGDWEVVTDDQASTAPAAAAPEDNKGPEAAAPANAPEGATATAQPQPAAGPVILSPEQAALAAEVETQLPTPAPKVNPEKPARVLKDVSHLLPVPGQYRKVKEDSVMHKLFKRLCDPKGISREEAMEEFNWTAGGWGGIIHWEPKHKGYHLHSEKIEGVVRYFLHWHQADEKHGGNGHLVKVKPEEIHVEARKVQPTPEEKAAERAKKDQEKEAKRQEKEAQRQAEKDAKAAAKAATAPAGAAAAPTNGAPPPAAAGVTTRVSKKKQEAQAAAAAAAAATAAPQQETPAA